MSNSQPLLPKPQLELSGITSDQYLEFIPEKLQFYDEVALVEINNQEHYIDKTGKIIF